MMRNVIRKRRGACRRLGIAWMPGVLFAALPALPGHASADAGIQTRMEGMLDEQALTGAAWMLIAILQWCVVLAAWGMLPLRTWA